MYRPGKLLKFRGENWETESSIRIIVQRSEIDTEREGHIAALSGCSTPIFEQTERLTTSEERTVRHICTAGQAYLLSDREGGPLLNMLMSSANCLFLNSAVRQAAGQRSLREGASSSAVSRLPSRGTGSTVALYPGLHGYCFCHHHKEYGKREWRALSTASG